MAAPQPILCRPTQAPAILGISRTTLYRWISQGHVTKIQRGSMTFVRVSEVMAYITGEKV